MRLSLTRHSVHPHLVWVNTEEGLQFLFHPDRRCCAMESAGAGMVGGGGAGYSGGGMGNYGNEEAGGNGGGNGNSDSGSSNFVCRDNGVGGYEGGWFDYNAHSSFTLPPLSKC